MSHTIADKKALLARVRRIAGQVSALERALESEDDCEAILQQVASIRGATQGLMARLVEGHVRDHVAVHSREAAAELEPVLEILRGYLK
ncbi:metal/formaldehyde-sensitive transcriptional repressor [Diaphorobacter ruginosibacter]|uniref:Metal/formaldehyde-sensitive transcriptional repressor n=1 Tax=Diaphorobacter ruginosibacter TaxID=1715720 RepID=A0A7G9RSK7_9BURK|nr:metal/formaldehyde-sensitive transcriptional repressor [Diaphorobacter ruginosibacter]QNN58582.1 metal/formaldehyde-sensitive transcriptional repressor [Diaphorobacter ruginosibacter]